MLTTLRNHYLGMVVVVQNDFSLVMVIATIAKQPMPQSIYHHDNTSCQVRHVFFVETIIILQIFISLAT